MFNYNFSPEDLDLSMPTPAQKRAEFFRLEPEQKALVFPLPPAVQGGKFFIQANQHWVTRPDGSKAAIRCSEGAGVSPIPGSCPLCRAFALSNQIADPESRAALRKFASRRERYQLTVLVYDLTTKTARIARWEVNPDTMRAIIRIAKNEDDVLSEVGNAGTAMPPSFHQHMLDLRANFPLLVKAEEAHKGPYTYTAYTIAAQRGFGPLIVDDVVAGGYAYQMTEESFTQLYEESGEKPLEETVRPAQWSYVMSLVGPTLAHQWGIVPVPPEGLDVGDSEDQPQQAAAHDDLDSLLEL